ncbi:MAG: hypothetical protein Ct9H300mP23_01330 [Nitrospinota bacterium]|nr:MAG: hypothetical protein Ct9H300mP23_01330 [Nitrospinota bacterium]
MAAHWKGAQIPDDFCYMHISRPGYTGIARVSEDSANVVLVVDLNSMRGENPDNFYRHTVMKNRGSAKNFAKRRTCGAGPSGGVFRFFSKTHSLWGPLLAVGDAMGFIDPFTGEGIYLSLRSSEIAVEIAVLALKNSDVSVEFLKLYDKKTKARI